MGIRPKVQNIRLVYCSVHQGIQENELADSLADSTASKKSKTSTAQHPTITI